MISEKGIFQRTELLLGSEIMSEIAHKKVIIFGIGGVGSWCAESLIRSGIQRLTLVDSDRVCITNINRQLHATALTVGEVKTDALKRRLLEINPAAEITAIQKIGKHLPQGGQGGDPNAMIQELAGLAKGARQNPNMAALQGMMPPGGGAGGGAPPPPPMGAGA